MLEWQFWNAPLDARIAGSFQCLISTSALDCELARDWNLERNFWTIQVALLTASSKFATLK